LFSELPKLFDRDFAIGYFLPVACFIGALYGVTTAFNPAELHFLGKIAHTDGITIAVGTTITGLATWVTAVLLLMLNHTLYQLFEGYIWPCTNQPFRRQQLAAFKKLSFKAEQLYTADPPVDDKSSPEVITPALNAKRHEALIALAERFPYNEDDVLATAFGNTIRAFETYSKKMYGFEAIDGWLRLLAVIPKDYRQMIDSAKAQTDFWLNLWFFSYLVFGYLIFIGTWSPHHHPALWLLSLAPVFTILISRSAAISAARDWGAVVKASFDVFLPDLCAKMRISTTSSLGSNSGESNEFKMWTAFSRATLYRDPRQLPSRAPFPEESAMKEVEIDSPTESAVEDEPTDDDDTSSEST